MTQEDKSEEYLQTAIITLPFVIIIEWVIGFGLWALYPHLGPRILLSIPFTIVGYGAFVYPIADLAGMRKLNTIGAIVYALLAVLFITLVALLVASYPHVPWVVLLGIVATMVASGFTCIYLYSA